MTSRSRFTGAFATALLCLLAAGCGRSPDPAPAASGEGAAADATAAKTFIGRKAAEAIELAGRKLKTENIRVGDGAGITIDGRRYGAGAGGGDAPRAEITPDGQLLVAGEAVPTTPEQRALLLAHRRHLEDVALAGMAIGAQGADIAGTALAGIGEALFGGEEGRKAYEARVEAEAARVKADAIRLCTLLPPLHESQQALAEGLPAFAPYATMTLDDVADCGKDRDADSARDAGGSLRA